MTGYLKYIFRAFCFMLAVFIAFELGHFFRQELRAYYLLYSVEMIQFAGKDVYFFMDWYHYLVFGFCGVIVFNSFEQKTMKRAIFGLIIFVILFFLELFIISVIHSQLLIVQCTMCDQLHPLIIRSNALPYDEIITGGLIFSVSCVYFSNVKEMFLGLYKCFHTDK